MSIRQKFGLGAFLTVNLWLIVIALIRVTSFKRGETFDLTWTLFFQFFEPNVAILAACFSAFRSLFVSNGSKRRKERDRAPFSVRQKLFRKTPPHNQQLEDLPTIPGATLKGLRTTIWQNNRTKIDSSTSNEDSPYPTVGEGKSCRISHQNAYDRRNNTMAKHDWSFESARV